MPEAFARGALDHLREHVVARIAIFVTCARLKDGLRPHLAEEPCRINVARPAVRRIDDVVVLRQTSCVGQQMPDRYTGVRRERGHVATDRIVKAKLAVLGE